MVFVGAPYVIVVENDLIVPGGGTVRLVDMTGHVLAVGHLPSADRRVFVVEYEPRGSVRLEFRRDVACPRGLAPQSMANACHRTTISDWWWPEGGARFEWNMRTNIVRPFVR